MPIEKSASSVRYFGFRMYDSSGADKAGTPTIKVSKDGGSSASGTGTLAAVSGLATTWSYLSAAGELNADLTIIEATLSGAITQTLFVYPEGAYTAVRGGYLDRVNTALPNAAPAANGGLATVDASNRIAGIQGAINNLNNLDAAVSTRSTLDAAGVWAAAIRTLTTASDSSGVTTLLARLTSTRATNLDNLDAAVSSRSTYAGGDTSGTTTLLGLLTPTRAGYLDAAISSRSTFAGGAVASVTAAVTVGTNNDKTGYSLTQAFPANFATLSINGSGFVTSTNPATDLSGIPAAVWGSGTRSLTDKAGFALTPSATAFNGIQPNSNFFLNAPSGGGGGGTIENVISFASIFPSGTVPVTGNLPDIRRGDSYPFSGVVQIDDLPDLSAADEIWITAKPSSQLSRSDAGSDFQVSMTGGLLVIGGGKTPPTPSQTGTLELNGSTSVRITLSPQATAALTPQSLGWDLQAKFGDDIQTVAEGGVIVVADYTRATS